MANALRRELAAHKLRTGRADDQLVFGRTSADAFVPSTVRLRALDAWGWRPLKRDESVEAGMRTWRPKEGGATWVAARADALDPIGLHEARQCAASFLIAAGLNAKELSVYMGHSDIRVTFDIYGHLWPGGLAEAADRLSAFLDENRVNTAAGFERS